MSKRIFLSYRREDSAGQTGRICDRLIGEFGRKSLFMDVDGIPLGADFVKRLNEEVANCDVFLAVIGSRWLDALDASGSRRIDNSSDFVRIEIGAALERDIPIIPVLLDGVTIPPPELIPEDIRELTHRHGIHLRHQSFHRDLDQLVNELKRLLGITRVNLVAVSLVSCIAGAILAHYAYRWFLTFTNWQLSVWYPDGEQGILPANMWRQINIGLGYPPVAAAVAFLATILLIKRKRLWIAQSFVVGVFSFYLGVCGLFLLGLGQFVFDSGPWFLVSASAIAAAVSFAILYFSKPYPVRAR